MKGALFFAVGCALWVVGCSKTTMILPATVEGIFSISVEKGDVDDNDISEVNFGTLTVNGVEHLVQVSGAVMKACGVPREGAKVRATLGSRTDAYGAPTYIITAMARL